MRLEALVGFVNDPQSSALFLRISAPGNCLIENFLKKLKKLNRKDLFYNGLK